MRFMKLNNDFSSVGVDFDGDFDARFNQLLSAWNVHQDIRFGGADLNALWGSRQRLAAVRAAVRN